MPAKTPKKDNVSKNMSARYTSWEPQNIRSKPHVAVIDIGSYSRSNQSSSNATPSTPFYVAPQQTSENQQSAHGNATNVEMDCQAAKTTENTNEKK